MVQANKIDRGFVRHERRMFDAALLAELRDHLIMVEGARNSGRGLNDRERRAVERGESSDALRKDPRWYEVWSSLSNAGRELLGPFRLVRFPVQVRHVRAVGHQVPWHQDSGYIKLLGPSAPRQIITCFIPLDEDPYRRTTLQFAELEKNVELEHEPMALFGAGVGALEPNVKFSFELCRGDALVFGDWALHRTFTPLGAMVERYSLEFRLIAREDAISGRDYFDIDRGSFVKHC